MQRQSNKDQSTESKSRVEQLRDWARLKKERPDEYKRRVEQFEAWNKKMEEERGWKQVPHPGTVTATIFPNPRIGDPLDDPNQK